MSTDVFEPHPLVRLLGKPAAEFTCSDLVEAVEQLVQHEIEFWPVPVEQAADALVLAKWVVREVAYAQGLEVTFAPSVSSDGAGSGLHVHTRLVRDGASAIVDEDGINDTARRLIAGYLSAAKALTAFGNTVPTSYLRFTDGDESPEGICWGETDRTGLVRVPLAWVGDVLPSMVAHANSGSSESIPEPAIHPQTVEFRLGDGSADVHLLLAGMAVAARRGLSDSGSLERAARLNADDHDDFEQLPASCAESVDALESERASFEADEPGSRWSTAFAGASLQAMSEYDAILARLFAPFAHDLVDRLTPASGDAALDVAAGPGTVSGILAERVGPTGRVVATDLSPANVLRELAQHCGHADILREQLLRGGSSVN